MSVVRKIAGVTFRSRDDRRDAIKLLLLMTAAAAMEILGIGLVIPFVSVIERPEIVEKYAAMRWLREATGATTQFGVVVLCGGCLTAAFLVKNAFLYFVQHRQYRFTYRQQVRRSAELLASYIRRPYTFHLQSNSSELLHTINYEVAAVYQHMVVGGFQIVVEALSIVVIGALLVLIEPVIIPGVALSLGLVSVAFFRALRRRANHLAEQLRRKQLQMVKATQQGLGGVKETLILGCERHFIRAFEKSSHEYGSSLVVHGSLSVVPRYALETFGVLALVLITIAMFARGGDPRTVLPVLGALAVAGVRLLPSMARILAAIATIRFHEPELDALAAALGPPPVTDQPGPSEDAPAVAVPITRDLRLRDVHYTYPTAGEPSVRAVSMAIQKGESVGFVGPSGSGKTTIADIIVGLLTPERGVLEVDGVALEGARLRGWQRQIGYISQTIFLCDDTIRRNIAFGVEDDVIDEDRIATAVKAAQLDDFVAALPEGLETIVGERGVRLSGGQRQRIGIARALYRAPAVLVLDEATSALDGATERDVVDAIERARAERTTIVVAHRLSTVKGCDRIVLVEAGEIADSGTWEELYGRSAMFRQMVETAQLDGSTVPPAPPRAAAATVAGR